MPMFLKSLILIIFLVGIIILQIFLSKRKNKWFGLILPMVNVIASMMAVYGMAFSHKKSVTEIILQFSVIFLSWNISTISLISIYFTCREKLKKKKEMDKINI
jgi:uncharacterized membrane protein YoaK (UPF0700 family)